MSDPPLHSANEWFRVANVDEIPSPALLLYPDRIRENLKRMIEIAGSADRLRTHVKTHKLSEVLELQLDAGIKKFKCATIAEAEMAAGCAAPEVLIAYPMVGPNAQRLCELVKRFPTTKFAALADDASAIQALSKTFNVAGQSLEVWLDIDCGQHRTGIEPGPKAVELYHLITTSPGLRAGGLHVYDGHINESDLAVRTKLCEAALAPVEAFRQGLGGVGQAPRVIAGGTPTFPIHAKNPNVECSPGTCVLWDFGYSAKFKDLDFLHAALVLTRVVSKPGENRLCLDLGHKAIAAENPHPRVHFLNLPDAAAVTHSEEHLVVESQRADEFAVGDCLYGIPRHVCPTVALYSEAVVVRDGSGEEKWRIDARKRRLTV